MLPIELIYAALALYLLVKLVEVVGEVVAQGLTNCHERELAIIEVQKLQVWSDLMRDLHNPDNGDDGRDGGSPQPDPEPVTGEKLDLTKLQELVK